MKPIKYNDLKRNSYYMAWDTTGMGKRVSYFQLVDSKPKVNNFTIVHNITAFIQGDDVEHKDIVNKDDYLSFVYPEESFYELSDAEVHSIIIPIII